MRLGEAAALRGPAAAPVGRATLARRLVAGSLDRAVDVAATLELRGYAHGAPRARSERGVARATMRASRPTGSASPGWPSRGRICGLGSFDPYPLISIDSRRGDPGAGGMHPDRRGVPVRSRPTEGPVSAEPLVRIGIAPLPLSGRARRDPHAVSTWRSSRVSWSCSPAARDPARRPCCAPAAASFPTTTAARWRARSGSRASTFASTDRPSWVARWAWSLRTPRPRSSRRRCAVSSSCRSRCAASRPRRSPAPSRRSPWRSAIPQLLDRTVDTLSGGELQRVALAAALVGRPRLALLDEPTSQLDPVAGDELIGLLRRLNEEWGMAVVLAEHRLERCLTAADRVLAMDRGRIAFDGEPAAFLEWALGDGGTLATPAARLFALAGLRPVAGWRQAGPRGPSARRPRASRSAAPGGRRTAVVRPARRLCRSRPAGRGTSGSSSTPAMAVTTSCAASASTSRRGSASR